MFAVPTSLNDSPPSLSKIEAQNALIKLEALLYDKKIILLPTRPVVTLEDLIEVTGDSPVVLCDTYLKGIEINGEPIVGGFKMTDPKTGKVIWNIDHHAPVKTMQGLISSGVLALDFIRSSQELPEDAIFVVNHCDCDSIVSLLIMTKVLPTIDVLGQAVLAADHIGSEDDIADLLQPLDDYKDIYFSATNLIRLLAGEALEQNANLEMLKHKEERQKASVIASPESNQSCIVGSVATVWGKPPLNGEFFAPLFPDSSLVLIVEQHENKDVVRLRLTPKGMNQGLNLQNMPIEELVLGYGGRWNAGSNSRAGGLKDRIDPKELAARLDGLITCV